MKVLIAGSRGIKSTYLFERAIKECGFDITEVVSGGAIGVDQMGEKWAYKHDIPVTQFLPDYEQYGKRAPLLRNVQMVEYADCGLFIWDGKSSGTAFTIAKMRELKKPVRVLKRVIEDRLDGLGDIEDEDS